MIFVAVMLCASMLHAQEIKIDKDLRNLVNAVMSLRQPDSSKKVSAINSVKSHLSRNMKWRLMDELRDENNGECFLSKKMTHFGLNPILNGVLIDRKGRDNVPGHMLNSKSSKYDYSLIEKGVKAKKTVKYTLKGRIGKQDFVIIPYTQSTDNLSVRIYKGADNLKYSIQKDKGGCLYMHVDTNLKRTDCIMFEIENKSNTNVAVVIINHNMRK